MNDQQREAHLKALLEERAKCAQYDKPERVAAIDEELAKFGNEAEPPVKRAVRRKAAE